MGYAKPNPSLTPGDAGKVIVKRHVSLLTKAKVYHEYGIPLLKRLGYVIDHLIPLEIGGTNDIKNLWPQPREEAKMKDKFEDSLASSVRSGAITMAAAQHEILKNWGG